MIRLLQFLVLGGIALGIFSACDPGPPFMEEPERPAIPQYPTLSFEDTVGVVTTDAFVSANDTFIVRLNGQKGDFLLETLKLSANQQPLANERIVFDGAAVNNSVLTITGFEQDAFLWDVGIIAQADSSKVIYQFTLEDESGRTDILDILINTRITNLTPPIIRLLSQSKKEILTDESVTFEIEVDAIGAPLKQVRIFQGAEIVEADRLKFDQVPFASNPLDITGTDRRGFTKSLEITANLESGTQGYTLEYLDSLNNKFYQELAFDVIRRVVTIKNIKLPADSTINLDFLVSNNMNYADTLSELSDLLDMGFSNGNWRKQIAGVNGTTIRAVPDKTIDFDTIIGDNRVQDAWNRAKLYTMTDTFRMAPDTIPVLLGDPLEKDDLILAQNEKFLFLLKVTEADTSYTFDVKY